MDYQKRRCTVRDHLAVEKVKGLLITDFFNILYLTGFKTLSPHEKEAKLIITSDMVYLITDTRYASEASCYFREVDEVRIMIQTPEMTFLQIVTKILSEHAIRDLGFEKHDLSYAWFEYLQKALPEIKIVPIDNIVMRLRDLKDEQELSFMRKAANYTDECLTAILPSLREGTHENEVIHRMEDWVRLHGLGFSFDPIVAFDKHSALPHYNNKTSDGVLKKNSIILIDLGITYKNYCSDITRVFFMGKPTKEQTKAYDNLLHFQQKTIDSLQIDKKMEDIDITARQGLIEKGYPSIPHSTGHGLGLEVHEGIRLAQTVTDTVKDNMVLTIEPGIYYEGKWGMRIEDTVAVINGSSEALTKFPKTLTVL